MVGYYRAQTFDGALELLILDDSPEADEFLASVEYRCTGIHYTHRPGDRMSIGAKLNALMELARGDVLIRFDDDYLTLSGWFAHSPIHGRFCYWESDVLWPLHFALSPHDPFLPVSTRSVSRIKTTVRTRNFSKGSLIRAPGGSINQWTPQ